MLPEDNVGKMAPAVSGKTPLLRGCLSGKYLRRLHPSNALTIG